MTVSISVHVVVLLLFAFLMAWRAPNPPLPEYGIELNFGLDDAGTGQEQPVTPAQQTENEEEAAPEEEAAVLEEVEDQSADPVEESPQEIMEETEIFDDPESPDVIEEEEVTEEVIPVPEVPEEVVEKQEEKLPQKETEVNEKDTQGAEGEKGEETVPEDANQGDKTDEKGDQGKEDGKIDERALYGTPGGGGGSSLQMSGWMWDLEPDPNDTSNETGRIVFEIKIDDQGDIISVRKIEGNLSLSVEKIYRDEIEKLTFSKTNNLPPAPQSTGRITFIIKAK